jgi:hypothetical protein
VLLLLLLLLVAFFRFLCFFRAGQKQHWNNIFSFFTSFIFFSLCCMAPFSDERTWAEVCVLICQHGRRPPPVKKKEKK